MRNWARAIALFGLAASTHALADPATHAQAESQALALGEQAIGLRSVAGPGNRTPDVAALFRRALIDGGFAPADVTITPVGDTAYLIARWRGSDPSLKPLVMSGHMDVVEAHPADWTRDPFTPVIEHGMLFGRGATDMKLDDTIAISTLGELRREGFRPRRDIVLAFSGDEETSMKTGEIIAGLLKNAQLVLNVDGADGVLDERTGAPAYFAWSGSEKSYADYRLSVTNPGGHSSEPRRVNAIDQMARALLAVQAHRFAPELNDQTRSFFTHAAQFATPATARAMRAFAADPRDDRAVAVLSDDPSLVGKIGTTCVATMIEGGHALNALPQRVSANINCRIFPGHTRAGIMAELGHAIADPAVTIADVTAGSVTTPASPMRPDVTAALEGGVHGVYPGLPVFASMESGASDDMWFRAAGVPAYGMSPLFIKASEDYMHGLNERTPTASIRPALDIMLAVVPALSR